MKTILKLILIFILIVTCEEKKKSEPTNDFSEVQENLNSSKNSSLTANCPTFLKLRNPKKNLYKISGDKVKLKLEIPTGKYFVDDDSELILDVSNAKINAVLVLLRPSSEDSTQEYVYNLKEQDIPISSLNLSTLETSQQLVTFVYLDSGDENIIKTCFENIVSGFGSYQAAREWIHENYRNDKLCSNSNALAKDLKPSENGGDVIGGNDSP